MRKANAAMGVTGLINKLKENDEDFEWYPTTDEIIRTVTRDMPFEDWL